MIIIVDTREKSILPFTNPYEIKKLNEGDYTAKELLAYEKITGKKTVRIERKRSTAELALNLGKGYPRFERELQRLAEYERKILLFEFYYETILEFPVNSGIPKSRRDQVRMNSKFMLSRLDTIKEKYGIEIIYAGDRHGAMVKVQLILEQALDDIKERTEKQV